ncbi:ATP-binding cassette domain-containing protein [Streptomyces sp. P1-3]|uniref:ATP-binding cassette domain-containing protein n=1 Tax=Streptomyces sp. P1-3 TaxID=3421658 RepID=UPI003D364895
MDLRADIHLGQPRTAADALLPDAGRAAGADSVIVKVPYGLDTLVAGSNWGGTDLSGGQWQRIAVARAFYRDAVMLILDELTSAMDPRAEHLVISRFKELAAGKAAVFVTNNVENARIADRSWATVMRPASRWVSVHFCPHASPRRSPRKAIRWISA